MASGRYTVTPPPPPPPPPRHRHRGRATRCCWSPRSPRSRARSRLGAGNATLLLAADERSGAFRMSYGNLSGAAHRRPHPRARRPDHLRPRHATPRRRTARAPGPSSTTGAWSRAQILAALRAGQCYLNLHTAQLPERRDQGLPPARAAAASTFTPPPPPPPLPAGAAHRRRRRPLPAPGHLRADARRRSPTVQNQGYAGWIDAQFSAAARLAPRLRRRAAGDRRRAAQRARPRVDLEAGDPGPGPAPPARRPRALRDLRGLRPRTTTSATSRRSPPTWTCSTATPSATSARSCEDVTLSPAMGVYLDMLSNDKEDPETGRNPNENFAREILQLFSIGLYQLHPDGTLQLGDDGPADRDLRPGRRSRASPRSSPAGPSPTRTTPRSGASTGRSRTGATPMEVWPEHHSTRHASCS